MDQLSQVSVSEYHTAVALCKGYHPLHPEAKRNNFSTKHNLGKNFSSKPNLGKEGTALNYFWILSQLLDQPGFYFCY